MSDQVTELFSKLYLWQFSLIVSLALLSLGFTGNLPFSEQELNDGQENMAIFVAVVFFIATCVLKYMPPPETRQRSNRGPSVAISPTQIGLISRFTDWTNFEDAALEVTPDHKLSKAALEVKNTELRIELGTLQGIAMRQVTDKGVHQVKYRNGGDATQWRPSK